MTNPDDYTIYYTPPPAECFHDLKNKAIKLWQTYDNSFGYVDEKVNKIKDLKNISDNFMYIYSMFDSLNQKKLYLTLRNETKSEITKRMYIKLKA